MAPGVKSVINHGLHNLRGTFHRFGLTPFSIGNATPGLLGQVSDELHCLAVPYGDLTSEMLAVFLVDDTPIDGRSAVRRDDRSRLKQQTQGKIHVQTFDRDDLRIRHGR
jgi:hypothetical protein